MLRRPPTVITLTADDINAYEESRQKRLREQQIAENRRADKGKSSVEDPFSAAPEKPKTARSQQERIMGTSTSNN